jgi:hypothetical protein
MGGRSEARRGDARQWGPRPAIQLRPHKDRTINSQTPGCELCAMCPGDDIRFLPCWGIGDSDRPSELVPIITVREKRWKLRFSLVLATFIGACVPCAGIARADGVRDQLPGDRSWVCFDAEYIHRGAVWPPLNRAARAGTPP